MSKYTIGVDFGTGSGRVAIVNVQNGEVAATHVTAYKHGVITSSLPFSNKKLKRDTALQHPQDYLDVLYESIPQAIKMANIGRDDIIGLGIDFTSCTILPVDASLTPLCFDEKWQGEPHAWPKLWKHHAAQKQANKINEVAAFRNEPWLKRYGNIISSEWMLPKVLEVLEESPRVYRETYVFLEAADWLTSILTGKLRRNSCAAGFKGMWSKQDGNVGKAFLQTLHPDLINMYDHKLFGTVTSLEKPAGRLQQRFADRVGLKADIPIAMGMIDAHAGVIGAGVTEPGTMVLVMGTSTCHMLLAEEEKFIDGISGVVEDGIIPNLYAYEAGQAAVGDIFEWFIQENVPSYIEKIASDRGMSIHQLLEEQAAELAPGADGLLALDWHNGCRTPLVNADLSGVFIGLTLATKPAQKYRALIESTAFGTKLIIEQFQQAGIPIQQLVACGGLPQKNTLMMQIYADVMNMPIQLASNTITPAIGAAINGAVAAGEATGGYDSIKEATKKMVHYDERVYQPDKERAHKYGALYKQYKKLTDYFGKTERSMMHLLKNGDK